MMRSWLMLCLCLLTLPAGAHQLSTAYLNGDMKPDGQLEGAVQWRLLDLQRALDLDADRNGQLLWGEVTSAESGVRRLLTTNLTASADKSECIITSARPLALDSHYGEPYLVVPFSARCPSATAVSLTYSALFAVDASHKLIANLSAGEASVSRVLTAERRSARFSADVSGWQTLGDYLQQGVGHILVGLDHLLFLFCLLLTCVLTRQQGQWQGYRRKRTIVWQTLGIVTAFTLAHALTLTAATLGWLNFPSRWVEVGIAATVVLAALNNLWPLVLRLGWVTFGFGLLHGLGFASVLSQLGLAPGAQWLSIAGFNLGVELGQILVIAVLLPVLMAVRHTGWYRRYLMPAGSLVIAAIGFYWMLGRL